MDFAYITRNNFRKISGLFVEDVSINDVFLSIYEKNMSEILNHSEAKKLYKQKEMMEGDFENSYEIRKVFNKKYIFSVSSPKFHKDKNCEYLSSDFKNYLVPPVIEVLGEEKVKEFQLYCESTKKDFEGKSDEIFWLHVGARFKVQIAPESVLYHNSGIQSLEGMTILELRNKINDALNKSLDMINSEEISRVIRQYRYAPHMQKALQSISINEVKENVQKFYSLKTDIINSLLELYKKENNSDGYELPVSLLEDCGFEPCKGCWK